MGSYSFTDTKVIFKHAMLGEYELSPDDKGSLRVAPGGIIIILLENKSSLHEWLERWLKHLRGASISELSKLEIDIIAPTIPQGRATISHITVSNRLGFTIQNRLVIWGLKANKVPQGI